MKREIKITPLPPNLLVNREELRTSPQQPLQAEELSPRNPAADQDFSYILGTPVFDSIPFKNESPAIVPEGQYGIAQKVLRNTSGRKSMVRLLKKEYRAVAQALADMGIGFRVLNLREGDKEVGRWLLKMGCENLQFSVERATRWSMFPRDMFVYLEAKKTLLAHSRLFKLHKKRIGSCEIIHTNWAEGGRMLFSGDRVIIGRHLETLNRTSESRVFNLLKDKGMKIAAIPLALFYQLSRKGKGRRMSLYYDFHIDRSASLLRGKDGGYHLVLDPAYRTGELASPMPASESVALVRKACEKIQVRLHVPRSVQVPYATAVMQFKNGKTLATGGDEELLVTLEDVVGSGNLHVTEIPFSAYPVFASAGLHCLVTETPGPLIDW
ncbi:MAG: hypothetical protein JRI85_16445 [Deltaproteobacteria bacterium]|nr:hypothetical protein [Deltaproteobacteria bacterium]